MPFSTAFNFTTFSEHEEVVSYDLELLFINIPVKEAIDLPS